MKTKIRRHTRRYFPAVFAAEPPAPAVSVDVLATLSDGAIALLLIDAADFRFVPPPLPRLAGGGLIFLGEGGPRPGMTMFHYCVGWILDTLCTVRNKRTCLAKTNCTSSTSNTLLPRWDAMRMDWRVTWR